jgi:hypothetical protein
MLAYHSQKIPTVVDLYTAWWVDLDESECQRIMALVEANVNRFDCFGSPDWGCDVCPRHDDCSDIYTNLHNCIAILDETA